MQLEDINPMCFHGNMYTPDLRLKGCHEEKLIWSTIPSLNAQENH